jgi:hypothetical protein
MALLLFVVGIFPTMNNVWVIRMGKNFTPTSR